MAYLGASEYLVFYHVSSNVFLVISFQYHRTISCLIIYIYDHIFSTSHSRKLKDIIAAQVRQGVEGEMMMTRSANFALSGWKGSYWFELYHVYPKNLGIRNYFWVNFSSLGGVGVGD